MVPELPWLGRVQETEPVRERRQSCIVARERCSCPHSRRERPHRNATLGDVHKTRVHATAHPRSRLGHRRIRERITPSAPKFKSSRPSGESPRGGQRVDQAAGETPLLPSLPRSHRPLPILLVPNSSHGPRRTAGWTLAKVEAASRRFHPTCKASRRRFYPRWRARISPPCLRFPTQAIYLARLPDGGRARSLDQYRPSVSAIPPTDRRCGRRDPGAWWRTQTV